MVVLKTKTNLLFLGRKWVTCASYGPKEARGVLTKSNSLPRGMKTSDLWVLIPNLKVYNFARICGIGTSRSYNQQKYASIFVPVS